MSLARLCHTEESFLQLPDDQQALVKELAEILSSGEIQTPYEFKNYIIEAFSKRQIFVPKEVYEQMEPDDSLEVWKTNHRFLFAMGEILNRTSYTIKELSTNPWEELFERPEFVSHQILSRMQEAVRTGKPQHNITDWHLVKEKKSALKNPATVKVKMIAPYATAKGLEGIFALVKFRPLVGSSYQV